MQVVQSPGHAPLVGNVVQLETAKQFHVVLCVAIESQVEFVVGRIDSANFHQDVRESQALLPVRPEFDDAGVNSIAGHRHIAGRNTLVRRHDGLEICRTGKYEQCIPDNGSGCRHVDGMEHLVKF